MTKYLYGTNFKSFDEIKFDNSKKEELIKDFDEVKKVVEEYDKNQEKVKEQELLEEYNNIHSQLTFYNEELDDIVNEFDDIKKNLKTALYIKDKEARIEYLEDIIIDNVKKLVSSGDDIVRGMVKIEKSITEKIYKEFKEEIDDKLYEFYNYNVANLTNRVEVAWRRIDNIRNNRDLQDGVDQIKDKIRPQDK